MTILDYTGKGAKSPPRVSAREGRTTGDNHDPHMAQSLGFEPRVGYQPTHDFQSCANAPLTSGR